MRLRETIHNAEEWVMDAATKAIVKKPVAPYVEKVYEEGNFAALGIGT